MRFKVVLAAGLSLLLFTNPATASLGVGKVTREVVKYTARKFGLDLGSKIGRSFLKKAEVFIARHGDDGIRALKAAGPEVIRQTSRHGKDVLRICAAHGDEGASYLLKHMDQALPVWRRFGHEGTRLMIKAPGLGNRLIKEFGEKGVRLGNRLPSKNIQKFVNISARVPGRPGKELFLDRILHSGDKLLDFAWRHKWKLGAGVTIYALLDEYENEVHASPGDPDGSPVTKIRGNILQHMISRTWNFVLNRSPWIPLVLMAVILIWLRPLIALMWKIPSVIIRLVENIRHNGNAIKKTQVHSSSSH